MSASIYVPSSPGTAARAADRALLCAQPTGKGVLPPPAGVQTPGPEHTSVDLQHVWSPVPPVPIEVLSFGQQNSSSYMHW